MVEAFGGIIAIIIAVAIIALIIGLAWPIVQFTFVNAWALVVIGLIIYVIYRLCKSDGKQAKPVQANKAEPVKLATKPNKQTKPMNPILASVLAGFVIFLIAYLVTMLISLYIFPSSSAVYWIGMVISVIIGCLPLVYSIIRSKSTKKKKTPRK